MSLTVKLKGNEVKLTGDVVSVGDFAPECKVVLSDLSEKTVGGKKDKFQLLIAVPSLDTPVCATEARRFNEEVAKLENVDSTIISMDLPFAAKRFCTTEGVNIAVGSDFRNKRFGISYGILIDEGPLTGLLARAIFVVDTNGKVVYKQLVPEITIEPDYADVLNFLKK
ncbi:MULTISPECIES: thiol peroxidase [Calditerrivibrio]|uniref:Thiol peroxidase n=1 Tax=Calditerrivibrio nitroreducens TaxID=477976 RepID=A0A2J6WPC7_9BACT|nr:MAG: thiol peroxidase [Calditerrivibrio nitroreducens]